MGALSCHCPFKVTEGEVFSVFKKRGEHGNAFKVFSERAKLGHLQAELVSPLWFDFLKDVF